MNTNSEEYVIIRLTKSDYERVIREQEMKYKNKEYKRKYYLEKKGGLKKNRYILPPINFEIIQNSELD